MSICNCRSTQICPACGLPYKLSISDRTVELVEEVVSSLRGQALDSEILGMKDAQDGFNLDADAIELLLRTVVHAYEPIG